MGEGWCFLIDGLSYFPVIASLLLMRIKPVNSRSCHHQHDRTDARGLGLRQFLWLIRTVLLFLSLLSLMGFPYAVLLPIFARQVLHGGAETLGWLTAASGIGAGVGTFAGGFASRSLA